MNYSTSGQPLSGRVNQKKMKSKKIEIEKNAITAASNTAIFINRISHGIACGLNHKALSILYKDAKDHFEKLDEYLYRLYELDDAD